VGATWAISGGITRGDGVYVVDVGVRDVATRKLLRLFTVTGSDILAVADQAAARILSAANAQSPGPRLAEIETSSLDAYQHYVRSTEAANEGRYSDQIRELDAAIAADSGFVSAIVQRLDVARLNANHALERRLVDLFARSRGRASDWDRAVQDVYAAQHNGEQRRAELLAHDLVARFPRNPRAYERLGGIYMAVGRWHAADTVYQQALSLDSLVLEAGHGPCAPCAGLQGLSWLRLRSGDLVGGERAARRWVALQPDAPAPWSMLSTALAFAGRYPEALKTGRRAALLSGGEPQYAMRIGRILVMARRFDAADSAARAWLARPGRAFHANAFELQEIVLRERGQLRAADRVIDSVIARYPGTGELMLTKGNDLGRLGQWDAATRIYEAHSHITPAPESASPFMPLDGDGARAFCWHHALEADAIAGSGDTLRLRMLADSIQMISARSYYGRDWRLAHHVRGLIAMQGHRDAEAEREFQAARWGASGWTVTEADLARAQLALGQPRRAIATLREAYEAPPDAMARYAIRSELDLLMARAFQRAGTPDSSTVYATYVRRAWRDADPEIKAQLSLLEPASDGAAHAVADAK
jgi:tetratricopeptide (TPR) repeat protein